MDKKYLLLRKRGWYVRYAIPLKVQKDKSMKENLSRSDALILIYCELKRFNDRVERQEIQEIEREANRESWEYFGRTLRIASGGYEGFHH